ncbi:MAG: cryptochrome/photolyase family protein, partial [Bacteroidia bacterium]|nr:cryptochrome/photolyase family protein [Bacteroidia bacterium]
YISGSNYIKKMSNYKDGEWSRIWDALYWRFIYTHMEFFKSNHRTSMILYSLNRMDDEKRMNHLIKAEEFLSQI